MKKIDVVQATHSLAKFARELEQEPLVLTDGGHAIAALVPINNADLESMALSLGSQRLGSRRDDSTRRSPIPLRVKGL